MLEMHASNSIAYIGPANRYLIESGWQASAGLERLTVDEFEGRSGSGGVGLNVQA